MGRCFFRAPLVAQGQHIPVSRDSYWLGKQFVSVAAMVFGLAWHHSVDVCHSMLLHTNVCSVCVCVFVCPIAVDCGELTDPVNGKVMFRNTGFGAVARYRCSPGFVLSGDRSRTCKSDGTWSGSAPTCNRECWPCNSDVILMSWICHHDCMCPFTSHSCPHSAADSKHLWWSRNTH